MPQLDEMRRYLASTDLFRDLDGATFASVEQELEWVTLDAGEVLMTEGETGDCLYVVLSGRLRAFAQREQGVEDAVGEISPGESVGEMAIIADERRSATVRAIRPSLLVRLKRRGFERLEASHPEIMKHMARLLVGRLRQVNVKERHNRPLTIGIVAGTKNVSLAGFAQQFAEALSRIGATCHVNAEKLDSQLGARSSSIAIDAPSSIDVTNYLSAQERQNRFAVYEADAEPSSWTERVIRHSDRILIVVPGDLPAETDAEGWLRACGIEHSAAGKDLVLLHTGLSRTASGASGWLDRIPVDGHYHLWIYASQDFDRLARIVAGRATGLVLGGGGARGFAHIGVIRALQEAGVPIDFVGGASIGALIAAEWALGWDAEEMIEANRRAFRNHPIRGDYTLPLVSIVTARKATSLFESLLGGNRIEDQWRSYFGVSCNLSRGEMLIHRRGLFHECVHASSALPALDAPVFHNGDIVVDGALINNLPVDVMQKLCGGYVIAVDVSVRRDLTAPGNGNSERWETQRILRSGPSSGGAVPNVFSIVMRTVMLNSVIAAEAMKRNIDLYLKPPVESIGMFEWMAIDEAVQIGYDHAVGQLQSRFSESQSVTA